MAVYFVAHIRIKDPEEYQRYLDGAGEVFARYKGRYLSVDPKPELLEGQWDYSRCVLIRFESKSDFEAWYHSEEYQEILQYRMKAADCDTVLIEGK